MNKLHLGIASSGFTPGRDFALGPWCFIGAEDVCVGWDAFPFVEPFANVDALADAEKTTRDLANQSAFRLGDKLNALHGTNHSATFWRSMTILWLVACIQAAWRRYRHIEEFIRLYGKKPFAVEVYYDQQPWQPEDLNEFMDLLLYTPSFDFWLSSIIIRHLAPDHWELLPVQIRRDSPKKSNETLGIMHQNSYSRLMRKYIGRLSFDSVQGTRILRFLYSAMIEILPRRRVAPMARIRDETVFKKIPAGFNSLINYILEMTMPRTYGDEFPKLAAVAERLNYKPGRLLIDHVAGQSPLGQTIMAHALEAGERLIGFQHGAADGNSRFTSWSEGEKQYIAWITWGWTEQEDIEGRMVPLPSPYLSALRNKHHFVDDKLYLTGTKFFIRGNRFDSVPSPSQFLVYRKSKRIFFEGLDPRVRAASAYRPFLRSIGTLEDEEYVAQAFPDMEMLRGDLHKALFRCRLLVLDHPGTTLNIAMAANVPTICFWNPDHWPQCRQILPLFDSFRQAGMLFYDATEAAQFINGIWDDVESWWESVTVQTARHEWAYRYARTSPIWWWLWVRAVYRLAYEDTPPDHMTAAAQTVL